MKPRCNECGGMGFHYRACKHYKCERRKFFTESQAALAARDFGQKQGVQFWPEWCNRCQAYHITRGK